jgi:hypothetical protein
MAEFKLARFKYTWQGDWAAAGRYNPDDIVAYGGKVYTCLVTHNAAPDFYLDLNYFNNDTPPLAVPRWELVADGISWRGNWQPDTYYTVGDIVKQFGTVYICVEGHTSNSIYVVDPFDPDQGLIVNAVDPTGVVGFFNNDINLNQYWTVHITSKNWRIDWQPDTYYTVNDVVRAGGRTYRCNQSHKSSSSFDAGLEANIISWDIVNIADDWKGDWEKNTKYIVNDIVRDGGIVYRCVAAHKSALTDSAGLAADLDLGDSTLTKWEILHNSTQYRDTWVSSTPVTSNNITTNVSTIYKVNDVVKYGSYVWICNTFHTAGLTFDTTKWDIFCPGEEFDADWSPTTAYQKGDIVFYGGNVFVANTGHVNANPSTSTILWTLLFQSSNIRGTWNSLRPYKIGDVVRKGGNVYLALLDNTSQDPDLPNDGSSTNSAYWDLMISGIDWKGVWTLGNAYSTGDVVSWGETSYRCIDAHEATVLNRPDDDANGFTWTPIVVGNSYARLKQLGDIKTFGSTSSSTLDTKRVTVGTSGQVLGIDSYGEVQWKNLWTTDKVYYVSLTGVDDPAYGITPQKPWRTLRYALDNVTGYATVFVRTGVFEEILPLRVPAFVAVVGDELRSTVIKPAGLVFTTTYLNLLVGGFSYLKDLIRHIVREEPIGTTDPLNIAFGTTLYGEIAQDFSGAPGTTAEVTVAEGLFETFITRITSGGGNIAISGSNTITLSTNMLNARQQILNNKTFLKNEVTLYVENVFTDSTVTDLPANWSVDLDRGIDAIVYDMYRAGNWKTIGAADYFVYGNLPAVNKRSNMFLLRDGTGLRNMSLIGLSGTLGAVNSYGTRRPNAGAFASLDPGWGPSDTSAWVGTRSPYVQNVSTFGDGCIGMKVDGDLHGGGNQTIVANDFTQIISDGIGMWCNGTGRSELVSVFVYYCYIGYLCTSGGRIRGTNGNCSYGTFGAVSEGVNSTENPIVGTVNNRYYEADVSQLLCNPSGNILKVFFSNAGVNYSTGAFSVSGSGGNAALIMDEFRDGAVYEVRIVNRGDSSSEGGSSYLFNTNKSQASIDNYSVILAGSDENTPAQYRGMRIMITEGTGVGQYGYIAEYVVSTLTVIVGQESKPQYNVSQTFSSGNVLTISSTAHLRENDRIIFTGTKFGNIQDNYIYYVKSVVSSTSFQISISPGGIVFGLLNGTPSVAPGATPMTLHCVGWEHFNEGTAPVSLLDTTSVYTIEPRITFTSPGFTSTSGTLPNNLTWTSIASSGLRWVTIATGTNVVAYTSDGTNWSTSTMPASTAWTKIEYVGNIFIAVATSGVAAKSSDGISWSAMTMSTSAPWTDIAYNGTTYVITASGENYVATSTDATTWTTATILGGHTFTLNDNAKLSTAISAKFGTTSLALDGTNDYLVVGSNADFNYGTGDFTIEGWFYPNALSGTQALFDQRTAATEVAVMVDLNSSGVVRLYVNGSYVLSSNTTISAAAWTHIAISRTSGITTMYIGGVLQSTTFTDANTYPTRPITIGSYFGGATYFNGYVDEVRVSKGVARYTTTFTPATSAFAWTTGTVLLLHFDGTNNSTTILDNADDWTGVAYGKGRFVAVSSTGSFSTSTNGTSWTGGFTTVGLANIAYGENRFVALQAGAGSTVSAITTDGSTWTYGAISSANWQAVGYGQGLWIAVANGSSNAAYSNDGISWSLQAIGTAPWCAVSFANISKPGKFIAIAGRVSTTTTAAIISTGATAQARATVVAGRISEFKIWEPGSGYTSAPVMTITDPNNSSEVSTSVRIGNGVIANPTITNSGIGYQTTNTRATITGNGYKDQYQLGSFLVCDAVTRLPGPGDNLSIAGINDYTYKVLSYVLLAGSVGSYTLQLNIAKDLGREETPEHGIGIEIRQAYSQVRLTGHDFLDIGLGGTVASNYPNTLFPNGTVLAPEDEIQEKGGGRVFYTSTDQDGNFRVGELFAVEQATGTVTLNAQFFELQGLEELRLGGVTVGGSGVVIREFSTDNTFTADSNNIVPTQKAIKAYIGRRVSGGGADAITSSVTAGLVQIGPTGLGTTDGSELKFPVRVNFKRGVDGTYLAQTVFMSMS